MSSIDKYVESEARECNPNVRVRNEFGRIKGYIGNTKVFDIADRYGYLNESEKSIIQQGIRAYELQDEEYRRREAMRLENERVAACTALRQSVNAARQALNTAHHNAMQAYSNAVAGLDLSSEISRLQGFNLDGYKERATQLEQRIRSGSSAIESDYQAKLGAINQFERSINDNASTQEFAQKRQSLQRLSTNISNVNLPTHEVDQFRAEVNKLEDSLGKLREIENQLKKIEDRGLSGSIAYNARQAIRNERISSLEDVDRLIGRVQGQMEEIRSLEYQQKTAEHTNKLAVLDGITKSCMQLRSYVIEQHYEVANFRSEIAHAANAVLASYTELRNAEYTTCSEDRIDTACSIAQELLVNANADERTLHDLEHLLNEYEIYKRDDLLQKDNYTDYCKKVEELTTRGASFDEIEAFDPLHYENQKLRLLDELLKQDVREAISRTRTTFIMACKAMEDMGYSMLHYNMGDEELEEDGANDALACEAVYVIPGCEGVVWRLVASDCNISRKLVGVVRPDGRATPIETVREVAKKVEDTGEINQFFSTYAEASGAPMTVIEAVDSDTEGSNEVIRSNSFQLEAEGEAKFDALVASGDAAARQKWKTATPKRASATVAVSEAKENTRKKEKSKCHQQLQAKRMKK